MKRLKCKYCDYITPAGRKYPESALEMHHRWNHGAWKKNGQPKAEKLEETPDKYFKDRSVVQDIKEDFYPRIINN